MADRFQGKGTSFCQNKLVATLTACLIARSLLVAYMQFLALWRFAGSFASVAVPCSGPARS